MHIVPTNMTVAEYCNGLDDNSIVVNRDYQRSHEVWPLAAQSFLIESILLDYPVPKLALYQITDRVTKTTRREIVDGQQRTEAIKQFFDGTLRLSRTLEFQGAAGKNYAGLDEDLQDKFLEYALGFDLFVDATPKDVREIFRRINSYEVPLNSEEQRHAKFQGPFKWYIYHASKRYDDVFLEIGTFGQKQLVRMTDMKLLTEITHALINGITTTTKRSLDRMYEENDVDFDEADDFDGYLDTAMDVAFTLEDIHETGLAKPYAMYSLLLAIIHAEHDVEELRYLGTGGTGLKPIGDMARNLSVLAEVLDDETPPRRLAAFVASTEKATNTKANRETRFKAFLEAIAA